jgi:hypothetical protein
MTSFSLYKITTFKTLQRTLPAMSLQPPPGGLHVLVAVHRGRLRLEHDEQRLLAGPRADEARDLRDPLHLLLRGLVPNGGDSRAPLDVGLEK